jgi:hypothetical protein
MFCIAVLENTTETHCHNNDMNYQGWTRPGPEKKPTTTNSRNSSSSIHHSQNQQNNQQQKQQHPSKSNCDYYEHRQSMSTPNSSNQ